MDIINMKNVDGVFEQDMDPYSEYQHPTSKPATTGGMKANNSTVEVTVEPRKIDTARKKMNNVMSNIDEAIEGAELIFDFSNMIAERLRRF